MTRVPFDDAWTVKPKVSPFAQLNGALTPATEVVLPHDAMRDLPRSPERSEGSATGYHPGGAVEYSKRFAVPVSWRDKRVSLHFDGVYRDAVVFVNGAFAGHRASGYAPFDVPLDPYLRYGAENAIRVEARAHLDSRWYSGLGIHRGVTLSVKPLVHIAPNSITSSTLQADQELAVVEIAACVSNRSASTASPRVQIRLRDAEGAVVAESSAPVTVHPGGDEIARCRLPVVEPRLWDVDSPSLYEIEVAIADGGDDTETVSTGIRTVSVDPLRGLSINGRTLKLRGACIHHDNGVLGAVSLRAAEERRVRILKEAGFNAIRSAHNPASEALLAACDRLGMLVMDETFDMWTESKNPFDYSLAFPDWWERDLESLVKRDRNHPSVILYSIGNEVLDAGNPHGARQGRRLAEKLRALDPTRPLTNGVSGFVATLTTTMDEVKERLADLGANVGANELTGETEHLYNQISLSDEVTDRTEESHSVVDVVGHNYAHSRYRGDLERFPQRVVVGTETLARDIDEIWALVTRHAHVIGDFTWTGWDYLGEAGLGGVTYADDPDAETEFAPWPWLLAWCGDIDITGHRRPASYYREIVFGLRTAPFIAVERPHGRGKHARKLNWAWSDTVDSWDLGLDRGAPVMIEVYSASDEVELQLNGRSLGVRPTGERSRYRCSFEVPFEPGELLAVGRTDGVMDGTHILRTPVGAATLTATVDRNELRVDADDLAYVEIELRDRAGTLVTSSDDTVSVFVSGPAMLAGLGSARPATEERFDASSCTTFEGRALAVIRPTGAGEVEVRVSRGDEQSIVRLQVR
ncbi:DUF4982 domain-containing protein [Microbacterium sp. JZ70]